MEDSRGATSAAAGPGSSSRPVATTSGVDIECDQHHQHVQVQPSPDHGSWLCCVPCYWLRRNNSVHKASLTVATLIVMSLLVASPVLFLISSIPARESDRPRGCYHQVGALDCRSVVSLAPIPLKGLQCAWRCQCFNSLDIDTLEHSIKGFLSSTKHDTKYNLTQYVRPKKNNLIFS
jgi:hypothetical protein